MGRVRHNRPVRPFPHRSAARPLVAAALACVLLAGCGGGDTSDQDQASDTNVFAERAQTLVEKPRLEAAAKQAAGDGDAQEASALERLARTPTGIWLTPESYGADQVGAYVTEVVAATEALTVPLFVLYGIPDRDCTGGFSAGGLTADTYLPWVQAIAGALADAGTDTAAVLEPDALAGSVACGPTDRMSLLRQALQTLVTAGVTTYVDAGHSDWIPASEMAPLLEKVGVSSARGFATNVANYQPVARERAYGAELSGLLDGAHYVIDVGRSGDPTGTGEPVTDWCNPVGRALGEDPGFVDDDTALDALLWIKPPAESDGECHGGPAAGEVWLDRAVSLAGAAGW